MVLGKPQAKGLLSSQGREDTNLMDVLAEGRDGGELADEVQVGCTQRVEGTAVVHGQVLFIDLSHVLGQHRSALEFLNRQINIGAPTSAQPLPAFFSKGRPISLD